MAEVDIKGQLRERLSAPLEGHERRRIIIWHDPSGEFGEEFGSIADDPSCVACTDRPLRVVDSRGIGSFELKRTIACDETGSDLLVYASWAKDLSGRALKDNWIADVELYSEHFQADWLSLLASDIGASGEARPGLERFSAFMRAKARRRRFVRMMPHASTPSDVALGVVACCLGSASTSLADITSSLILSLDGDGLPEELAKYGANEALSALLVARIGYSGPIDDKAELVSSVAVTALSCTLPELASTLREHVLRGREGACLALWRDWQADIPHDRMLDIARLAELYLGMPDAIGDAALEPLVESDVLPCTGEAAVTRLMRAIADGSDRGAEALAVVSRRRDLSWYGEIADFCDVLEAASRMLAFSKANAGGFHIAQAADVWQAYVSDWSSMDSEYRRLATAADEAKKRRPDAPDPLRDALDAVCDWADDLYLNWFLPESNTCWVQSAEAQWARSGYVRDVPRQQDFWGDVVERELDTASKVAVIVSDALRYEVGKELTDRISAGTKAEVQTSSMQAVFPSVTEFGMAALLPHSELELRPDEGPYPFADGLPTKGTSARQAILQASDYSSRAIQAKDLLKAKRSERRDIVGDAKVLYVYHNLIDATGEEYPTEDRVLSACSESVDDLLLLVKLLMNDLRFNRIVVTADHGFLYTRRPVPEAQKVTIAEIGQGVVAAGRRYAITEEPPQESTFVRVKLSYKSFVPLFGTAPRECVRIKRPGSGELYVHGGVSLQELCVPVIVARFVDNRSKDREEQETASLELLSTSRRVTSAIFRVDLWQREPVGGKVLPAEYDVVLEDEAGEPVSDVRHATASSADPDAQARVVTVRFALKPGVSYSSRDDYFLVCRDKGGTVAWSERFVVEVAIAPIDDFGF
ncbi:MAG: BREX-1 system phosphatase PglZ type A [Olsenella umbonata]|nr:BREX-1 system phosphatase PglZ type A [Parafannyhessea umbonata]